jgi:hypothetical protein
MTPIEIGTKLVELVKAGKPEQAVETLYARDVVSIEAMPGDGREAKGIPACLEKTKQFEQQFEVHGAEAKGPFPNGDRFAVFYSFDITPRKGGPRTKMTEVGIYTVKNDKIAREEFFYQM